MCQYQDIIHVWKPTITEHKKLSTFSQITGNSWMNAIHSINITNIRDVQKLDHVKSMNKKTAI